MRIIVDKLKVDGGSDKMVFEISDEMLLKLGKKYFELATKGEKKDTTENDGENRYYLTDEDMMVCARKLKVFCREQGNCKGCPFVIEPTGSIYGCKIGCRSNNGKFYTPDNWEV